MSFEDHVALCHAWPDEGVRPFRIEGRTQGWVLDDFASALTAYPAVFEVKDGAVILRDSLDSPEARSAAVDGLLDDLAARGLGPRRRNESYPVNRRWDEPPAMLIDRGLVPYLGT